MIAKRIDDKLIKCIYEEYNSCLEVIEMSNTRSIKRGGDKRKGLGDWHGISSWDEVENYCKYGWKEEVDFFEQELKKVKQLQDQKKITFKNNITGYAPIVPLALKGVPDSMLDMSIKQQKSKCVKIVYNVNFGGWAEPEDIKNNGLKLLKALYSLELQGYRTQLNVTYFCGDDKEYDNLTIKLKDYMQPFSMQKIMFGLVHPSMFRTIGFDWENRLEKSYLVRAGAGKSPYYEYKEKELEQIIKLIYGDNVIFLAGKEIYDNNEEYIKEKICGSNKHK